MFTFPVTQVRAVISRGQADAAANGGFRNPHYGLAPGKDEKPGLWLVGDEGVYLLSNSKLADGQRPLVVYAEECDPTTNPDYWHYKRQHVDRPHPSLNSGPGRPALSGHHCDLPPAGRRPAGRWRALSSQGGTPGGA